MTPALQNRCWNHELREAVCRCPECLRSFCRECVTEHESRYPCASCIAARARASTARRRSFAPALLCAAGLILALLFYFGVGQGLLLLAERFEQTSASEPTH